MGNLESFGGSSGDIEEKAMAAVADFVQSIDPTSMVQRFVLLVEGIDEDDRALWAFVAPGQKRWDTMGMLQFAMTLEQNVVIADEGGDG